jgi:hypothetical protein
MNGKLIECGSYVKGKKNWLKKCLFIILN